jgi:hypothetical protein
MSDDLGKILLLAFVLVFGVLAWRAWEVKRASPSWPSVEGVMLVSQPRSANPNDAEPEHVRQDWFAEVRYRYTVNGVSHTGDRLRAFGRQHLMREDVLQELAPFPVGAKVKVYFDPARPERSVLIPG